MADIISIDRCEQEPIQWPGRIQAHGYLMAVDPVSLCLLHLSENFQSFFKGQLVEAIGLPLSSIPLQGIDASNLSKLVELACQTPADQTHSHYRVLLGEEFFWAIIHQHDGLVMIEFEPVATRVTIDREEIANETVAIIQRSKSLEAMLNQIALCVRGITGFDRVMVYRFDQDWHGEVVAEAMTDSLKPFLGLRYPASDIPRQARELYKLNRVRLIADVDSEVVPLLPPLRDQTGRPPDLTHANLRSVSPVHIEYLMNMGVQASMSISLLHQGELWGLIACHHYQESRFIDYPTRQAVMMVSQLLSASVSVQQTDAVRLVTDKLMGCTEKLNQQMIEDWDVVQGLTRHPVNLLSINQATGAALLFNDEVHRLGNVPSEEDIRSLVEWLHNTTSEELFQTNQLPNLFLVAESFKAIGSGILSVRLSRELREYIIWFKPEKVKTVYWGGNPSKAVRVEADGSERLSPRKSFQKWAQAVHNQSDPWLQAELTTALKLREDIIHLVKLKANQIRMLSEQLRETTAELEAFSYTVSHDLRTPLSSIRSYTEIFLEDFGHLLPKEAHDTFGIIKKASDRMNMLIRSMLYYSRTGRTELIRTRISIGPILKQLSDELIASSKHPGLTIQIGDTPVLFGDQVMITQVFSNLLSNAVKYSLNRKDPKVEIQGIIQGNEVIYSVSDNGIGIDMKQASRVFDLFQRLDGVASFEGDGVGLAIVKRIITRHGGKVWLTSVANQLTTFFVSLPSASNSENSFGKHD